MKIAVITPTYRYGGLDVNFASLLAQKTPPDTWIIADDLYFQRRDIVEEIVLGSSDIGLNHFRPREKPEGYFSDLANIYNEMMERAYEDGCDLAVSAQDYLWMPPDGIERFAKEFDENRLLTGSCSLSYDPEPDLVAKPEGLWTVYRDHYPGTRPERIWWRDVRLDIHSPGLHRCDPIQWELNWAAIPTALWAEGARFPEHYGRGIAHENIAFAVQAALDLGTETWIDVENHAIGLPHKHYWPEQEEVGLPRAMENMKMFHAEYGERLRLL